MKNILFLVHRIPYPPNKGDKIRSFNELKYLAKRHSVDLLCLVDDPKDQTYKKELDKICDRVETFLLNPHFAKFRGALALLAGKALSSRYFYSTKMQSSFDSWVHEKGYDAIFCFSSSMAEYIFESKALLQMDLSERPQLIMDFCDVDSAKWNQYSEDSDFPLNRLYNLEYKRLMRYEQRIQNFFDKTTLVSGREADYFRANFQNCDKLSVILNGVDHEFFSPTKGAGEVGSVFPDRGPMIVFTGAMDYQVNIKGVLWFVDKVWPRLLDQFPTMRFYVVGSNPAKQILDLDGAANITVTGFVDDIRDYYNLADICIAPLHQGRGLQNKVLEAMSMETNVVATSRANAGIQAEPGQHLLVADTADDFFDSICWFIRNVSKARNMGRTARAFVVSNFDWESNMAAFDNLLMDPEKGDFRNGIG